MSSTRTTEWDDPLAPAGGATGRSGIAFLRAILDGATPPAPIQAMLGFDLVEVEEGVVRFRLTPGEHRYNPMNAVHGGVACVLLDSAMGSAAMTTLDEKTGYASPLAARAKSARHGFDAPKGKDHVKLSRITKIRAYRVFRDFSWPSDLPEFAHFNLVFGWNGSGKTTLSSLLSHLAKRSSITEGEFECQFDGSTVVSARDFPNANIPALRVFNAEFIDATIQSAGSGMDPIYYLGEGSAEKQAKIESLRLELGQAREKLDAARATKLAAERELDAFCVDKAKVIKELLLGPNSQPYNNYDKRRFKQAVQKLTANEAAAAVLGDAQKQTLIAQKNAQLKGTIESLSSSPVKLAQFANRVLELVSETVVSQTLADLAADGELGAWVQRGLHLHSGHRRSDTCLFCVQPLTADRRAALEAHFNTAFAAFQENLGRGITTLGEERARLVAIAYPHTARAYEHLAPELEIAARDAAAASSAAVAFLDDLVSALQEKLKDPFNVSPRKPKDFDSANVLAERHRAAVLLMNAVIEKHNATTADFGRSVDKACAELEACHVAEAREDHATRSRTIEQEDAAIAAIADLPKKLAADIDAIEREVSEHLRPAEELTSELRAYLGRDELRFDVSGNGYRLTRSGQPVRHLSEGERTAIAFLYFLKSLNDKSFDLKKSIVVVDDPVSSLDANALFSAFAYMKERTKGCEQLFVLTHSLPFFRQVKYWFNHLNHGVKKSEKKSFALYSLHTSIGDDGCRSSGLGRLDPLLEKFESEYHYLFKRIYDDAHRPPRDALEHYYGAPNMARRFLETFLTFKFPAESGDVVRRMSRVEFDDVKKTRILRLVNTYSHADDIGDLGHDLSVLSETREVLLELLQLVKAVDAGHYAGLETLVDPPPS
jgi:wobble nucleotide-excising tRNase/acyl-coenzyme A thioesterase PaaI-like protein